MTSPWFTPITGSRRPSTGPVSPIARLNTVPPLLETLTERADHRPWRASVLFGYTAAALLLRLLPWVMIAPGALLLLYVTATLGPAWAVASTLVIAPLYVLIASVLLLITKRAVMQRAEPGIYPVRGGFGLRQWVSNHLVLMSVTMLSMVYCTLYAIPFGACWACGWAAGRRSPLTPSSIPI